MSESDARVHLREYIEALLIEHDKRYEQRFRAQEQATAQAITSAAMAVNKAETATERRFESVNEFRAALSDQARTLISRSEVEQLVKSINDKADERLLAMQSKIDTLNALIGASMPRSEAEQRFTSQSQKLDDLKGSERVAAGRTTGVDATKAFVFAIVAAVVGIIGVALAIYSNAHR